MKNTVRLTGFKELEASLSNLGGAVGKRVARAALRKAVEPMRDKAKELAPVDTGALRDSIIIGNRLDGRQMRSLKKLSKDQRSAVEVFMGPSYLKGDRGRHGHLVEFGTAPRLNGGLFKGARHPGTAPQPFMRPAWDAEKDPTIERLRELLWAAIDRAAKRKARRGARG
ncbi:MAG: HK97-gp10 family putative phage morphogenesis protein [Paracoccus sp. (in: a-proteobacteria)]